MSQEFLAPPTDMTPSRRFEGLDALRGLAILLVMVGHFLPESSFDYQGIISSLAWGGVLLFFYLSGFLIFRNVQKQPPDVFLLRRLFKLFPAYWVNMAVIIMLAGVFHLGTMPDLKSILAHALMLQEFTHSKLMNDVYWTLQIELKFYFVMAAFCYVLGAHRIYMLLAALLLLNTVLLFDMGRGSTLITYLIAFFPGIAAARITERGWNKAGFIEMAIVTGVVAGNLFLGLEHNIYQMVYSIVSAALLVIILMRDVRSAFFAFFGKISYSHYLYHALVGYILLHGATPEGQAIKIETLFSVSLITIAIAMASFYMIERPGIKLGYRIEKILPRIRFLNRFDKGVQNF